MEMTSSVTQRIIEALERGVTPWRESWHSIGSPNKWPSNHKGRRYAGGNVLTLWLANIFEGHTSNLWMTKRQGAQYEATLRSGARGETIMFWGRDERIEKDADGFEVKRGKWVERYYVVYNACQFEGLPEQFQPVDLPPPVDHSPVANAQAFLEHVPVQPREHPSRNFYSVSEDAVYLVPRGQFVSIEDYYATYAHELIHWTGPDARCARRFGTFGSHAHAKEELVAELGSAFVCAHLSLPMPLETHAAYIDTWIKVLKEHDNKNLHFASEAANKAFRYLCSFQPKEETDGEIVA